MTDAYHYTRDMEPADCPCVWQCTGHTRPGRRRFWATAPDGTRTEISEEEWEERR